MPTALARVTIGTGTPGPVISRHVHGHFAEHLGRCIAEGFWVGEDSPIPNTRGIRNDVVAALKALGIPNLRWPGGCFADEYHWRDGIGPRERRPAMVNTHWGGVTENNHFGTHEFMDLCAQVGCDPYICGNVGSGSVREMQEWVDYLTFDGRSPEADERRANGHGEPWRVPFFGVGNESWGCGGSMRPEFYADEYRRYQTFVKNYGANVIQKIACGPNEADYAWTEVLMREAATRMWGLSLHMYTWTDGPAAVFDQAGWFACLKRALWMEELVEKHGAIMDRFDPERKVALVVDEWGTWHKVEPGTNPGFLFQQSTVRDALVAGVTLNIFHRNAGRVRMANLAQTANVLQALVLTDGPRMLLTPTYHVFEMYAVHKDAAAAPVTVECAAVGPDGRQVPAISVSASVNDAGVVHVSLCNLDPVATWETEILLPGRSVGSVAGRALTGPSLNAQNTFERPAGVRPVGFSEFTPRDGGLTVRLPPASVVTLAVS